MDSLEQKSSFDNIIFGARDTFARFPLTVISAIIVTVMAVYLADTTSTDDTAIFENILRTAFLGLPLFTMLVFLAENKQWIAKKTIISNLLASIVLIGYYLSLPEDIRFGDLHFYRFGLLLVTFHFMVAFVPYINDQNTNGFWQYNKSLFIRFLTAYLYSSVMYIGLTLVLSSAEHLFDLEVKGVRYAQLAMIVMILFHTFVFLAGLPKNIRELSDDFSYPKGLKVFTQYILLPLVFIYIIILYAYELKIIFTWNWPKGWVSQMVLWFSVTGIMSLLLLYPIKEKTENKWIKVFSKWFFIGLLPLVMMLFFSIFRRISDYGITVNRYLVLIMAIGLLFVVLYFIISKVKDIKVIPMVIAFLAFLSAYGPLSAFSVSLVSQQGRLESLMTENNIFVNGSIDSSAGKTVSFDNRKEMSSIIMYLTKTHGFESFSSWIPDSLLILSDSSDIYTDSKFITEHFGFTYVTPWDKQGGKIENVHSVSGNVLLVSGYDYVLDMKSFKMDSINTYQLQDDSLFVSLNREQKYLSVFVGQEYDSLKSYKFLLSDIVERDFKNTDEDIKIERANRAKIINRRKPDVPQESLTFKFEGDNFEAKLWITFISRTQVSDSVVLNNLHATLFLKMK